MKVRMKNDDKMTREDKILDEEEKTHEAVEEISEETSTDESNGSEIEDLKAQLTNAKETAARALADYQNLIRRHREERASTIKYAVSDFVVALIEPYDHLRLAAQSLNDTGLNIVVDEFLNVLKEQNVTLLIPEGKNFNPQTMEAVEKDGKGNKVTKVLSPGYLIEDRVIRPARVTVG